MREGWSSEKSLRYIVHVGFSLFIFHGAILCWAIFSKSPSVMSGLGWTEPDWRPPLRYHVIKLSCNEMAAHWCTHNVMIRVCETFHTEVWTRQTSDGCNLVYITNASFTGNWERYSQLLLFFVAYLKHILSRDSEVYHNPHGLPLSLYDTESVLMLFIPLWWQGCYNNCREWSPFNESDIL